MKKRGFFAGALVAATIALGVPGAYAASDHGISGTAYSSGATYVSANARYKEGAGAVSATFNSLPKNGLYLYLVNASNAGIGTPKSWSKNETNIRRTLHSNLSNNYRFYNAFRLVTGCSQGGCSPYEFSGSERY